MHSPSRFAAAVLASVCALSASSTALGQTTIAQLNAGFGPDPGTLRGVSGGPVQAEQLGPACRGYFPQRPQHRIQTSGLAALRMFTLAEGNADVTLAIVGNGQVFCDDDAGGSFQARLDLRLGAGSYDVFVGSYSESATSPYALVFTTDLTMTGPAFLARLRNPSLGVATPQGVDAGVATTGPDASVAPTILQRPAVEDRPITARPIDQAAALSPTGSNVRLRAGSRPQRARGRTGGTIQASSLQAGCAGFIFQAPTHRVTVDQAGDPVRFNVTSAADTTLLVRTPDGQVRCHDDIAYPTNRNPEVLFPAAVAGTYSVWVGIFASGSRNLYQLTVSSGTK
jgi:hypothetical protein